MSHKIGLSFLCLFMIGAGGCIWWLSVPHISGSMEIYTLEHTRNDRPTSCHAGVGHNPFVYGVKIGFGGQDELLVDDRTNIQNPFVVFRSISSSSSSIILTKSTCRVFQQTSSWHQAPLYDPSYDVVSGSIDLDCPLPEQGRLRAHLTYKNCEEQGGEI